MDRADWLQQEELERERFETTLLALDKVRDAGLIEESCYLARELGVGHWWIQQTENAHGKNR